MTTCIFCKIVNGELPSKKVLETDEFLAFLPLKAVSPVHVICIPKNHIEKIDAITGKIKIWDELFVFANKIIEEYELDKTGYRIVNNGAGYHSIDHEHIHVLGGKNWRPNDDL